MASLTHDGHPDDAHLIHVLLHLLLTGVLLSRLTRRCNKAVVRIQALMDLVHCCTLFLCYLGAEISTVQ